CVCRTRLWPVILQGPLWTWGVGMIGRFLRSNLLPRCRGRLSSRSNGIHPPRPCLLRSLLARIGSGLHLDIDEGTSRRRLYTAKAPFREVSRSSGKRAEVGDRKDHKQSNQRP